MMSDNRVATVFSVSDENSEIKTSTLKLLLRRYFMYVCCAQRVCFTRNCFITLTWTSDTLSLTFTQ